MTVGAACGQGVRAVPKLDMGRFVGVWYELARIPAKKEKCVSDELAIYTVRYKAGRFAVVNSCKAKDGGIETKNGSGKAQDKSGDGRLKVSYTWPFYHKRWVLATGAEYEWALVGSPDHKMLAVLGRKATLPPELLAEIKGRATAEGFDVGKLAGMPQTP